MLARTLSAVAASALLLATPAVAQTDSVSVTIKTADLNLASNSGQARLERRVRRAAHEICGRSPGGLNADQLFAECRADVVSDAHQKIAALTSGQSRIQVARRDR